MADELTQAEVAIVPTKQEEYRLSFNDYDAAGNKSTLTVTIPGGSDYKSWPLLARAAILKGTTWKNFTVPAILLGIMYADRLGLDIELGDVYSTDGRPALSAEARIKLAQAKGLIRGIKTTWREIKDDPAPPGCVLKNDLECTVTIKVRDWDEPIVRTARLSRWFKNTPAWKERPEHQLELNTIGHACRLISPIGDPEDAPPLDETKDLTEQLTKSITQGGSK